MLKRWRIKEVIEDVLDNFDVDDVEEISEEILRTLREYDNKFSLKDEDEEEEEVLEMDE